MTHVRTAPHEVRCNLLFDGHDDRPYWVFRALMSSLKGDLQYTVHINGEQWHVTLGYNVSSVAPRPDHDADTLYEYTINAKRHGEQFSVYSALLKPSENDR